MLGGSRQGVRKHQCTHHGAALAVGQRRHQRLARLAVLLLDPDDGRQGVGYHDVALLKHRQLSARVKMGNQVRLVLSCMGRQKYNRPKQLMADYNAIAATARFACILDMPGSMLAAACSLRTRLEAQRVRLVLELLLVQHDVRPQAGRGPGPPVQDAAGVAICTWFVRGVHAALWPTQCDISQRGRRVMLHHADCCTQLYTDMTPFMRVGAAQGNRLKYFARYVHACS